MRTRKRLSLAALAFVLLGSSVIAVAVSGSAAVASVGERASATPFRRNSSLAPGGTLYFVADDGVHGPELWKSDGTAAGTAMVTDLRPGRLGSLDRYGVGNGFSGAAGTLFFWANDGTHGEELWKSDGTSLGTVMVDDIRLGPRGSGRCCGDVPVELGSDVYFAANDGTHGLELWKSDGTAAGTVMLKDISPGSRAANPYSITDIGGTLFFGANDGAHGYELWKSDGTAAGTALVKDAFLGPGGSVPGSFTVVGETLYFGASDGTRGYKLWRSDGTRAGTTIVKNLKSSSMVSTAPVGDTLYLSIRGSHGDQLWKSDGTSTGTVLVKDFSRGRSCPAEQLTELGGALFFNVGIPRYGEELWRSDGTRAGTGIVKDIWPGRDRYPAFDEFCQYGPLYLSVLGADIYFSTDDGTHGNELWRSDGTDAGTLMVKDLVPGSDSSLPGSVSGFPGAFTDGGGTLFFTANDGAHGYELWRSDGTDAGTVSVQDINPGSEGSFPSGLIYIAAGSTPVRLVR